MSSVLESYSRSIKVGDSEGWCGPHFIVVIVRAFTAGEDAVLAWARSQDGSTLVDMLALADGRDYIILQRIYTRQSYRAALLEQQAHAKGVLQIG